MLSPWGDLTVVDAHVHFFSHRFFSLLAAQRNSSLAEVEEILQWSMPPEQPEDLAQHWVAELDLHQVSRAALIASLPGDEGSVRAAVAAYPNRFYGYFFVNPLAADAPALVARSIDAGLQGACLFPAMHRYSMHDERVEAVLQVLAARPATLAFVHCGALSVAVRNKLGLQSQFDLRYSNPVDVHAAALRHPKLPFVIPHFGAGYFREALMLADLCPNIFFDTSGSNGWVRYQYADLDMRHVFEKSLNVLGAHRLVFGTDSSFFPRGWHAAVFAQQVNALRQLNVSPADAQAIFGGNLTRLLARPASHQ